jgi:hypothetical protein
MIPEGRGGSRDTVAASGGEPMNDRLCWVACAGLTVLDGCGDAGGGDDAGASTTLLPTNPSVGETSGLSGTDGPAPTTSGVSEGDTQGVTSQSSQVGEDSSEGGIKFDVEVETSAGETGGPSAGGSCRPSEIHGAAGGFPAFVDPAYAPFIDRSVAVMTTNAGPEQFVLHIFDISPPVPTPNLNYDAPRYRHPSWTQSNIGRIFGLTLDSSGNIYVAPSTVYGANPSPATIKRIDGVTGAITDFATLPNNGPALGNINYDCISQTIYASNHEDGRIYQVDMSGQIKSTYRHSTKDVTMGPAADPGEPDGQFSPLGDRVWAVQSHAGRLYYSVWNEDIGRPGVDNEVWSVGYVDAGGVPDAATAKLEFVAPLYLGGVTSNPISDLSFAATGWMLISQRTMVGDSSTSAHQSTTYEYQYNNGAWDLKGTTFIVGELPGSAAGGVDHDFAEDGYVWMTGDALDFGTPNVVYGLQGTPHSGGDITVSTLIDYDGDIASQSKTLEGDVEIPIPGDAMPVPPPG